MSRGSVSYARIADRYEDVRGGAHRADELAKAVRPWLPREGIVCDVGAGTRVVTVRLAAPGRTLLACDLSIEMLRQNTGRLPGRVHQADATALPLSTGSIDALTYVWVLHHVGDGAAALAEARRVLRPGGRVVSISGDSLPIDDDMAPTFERLNERFRPGGREQGMAVARIGAELGLTVVHEGLAVTTTTVSPNNLAAAIDEHLFSHLWDLTDDEWRSYVVPAIEELRSLPHPDRAHDRVLRHPLVVFNR